MHPRKAQYSCSRIGFWRLRRKKLENWTRGAAGKKTIEGTLKKTCRNSYATLIDKSINKSMKYETKINGSSMTNEAHEKGYELCKMELKASQNGVQNPCKMFKRRPRGAKRDAKGGKRMEKRHGRKWGRKMNEQRRSESNWYSPAWVPGKVLGWKLGQPDV